MMINHRPCSLSRFLTFIVLSALPACYGAALSAADQPTEATRILAETGIQGGVIVHLGCGDGRLTAALQTKGGCIVHGLDTDQQAVRNARERLLDDGRYGRVSLNAFDGQHLPYGSNTVNLIVAERLNGVPMAELMRVLVPQGVAYVREEGLWQIHRKPWPEDMGQWPHYLHGADGNPVTPDRFVGPPSRLQWIAGPKWQRAHDTDANINALVSAGGRVFYMVDEAPIGLPGANGLPDKWMLAARDAFNGVLLWKRPVLKWGWREYKDTHYRSRHDIIPVNVHRRVVATGNHVFATLGIGAPVSRLNAATGDVEQVLPGTEGTREILYDDGRLFLTVPEEQHLRLVVVDAESGERRWISEDTFAGTDKETGRLKVQKQAVLNAATSDDVVCLMDGDHVVCLNRSDGTTRWKAKPLAGGDKLWAGTLIVHDGVILYSEQGRLTALSAKDGTQLWSRVAKQPGGLWFSWKDVYVIDGLVWTWGPTPSRTPSELHGLDLHTGDVKRRIPLGYIFNVDHHHRCYRNKATSRFIIASRRGAEFLDLSGGEHSVNNWVRGICHMGMMPANGLLYAPPEPCRCYWYERLSDFCALAPAPQEHESTETMPLGLRTRRGPAFGKADGSEATAGDWPTFRADASRRGNVATNIDSRLTQAWSAQLPSRPSAPIAVGDRVYAAATDAHTIYALDADSGHQQWHYTAGGRIDSPPTYCRGKLIFGSADGWVTCLRATDGAVVWRFFAAPRERLVGVHDQLESAWPAHGSVLVQGDTVYFAAGRSSHLDGGIHLYGLDLETGEARYHTVVHGPDIDLTNKDWFADYSTLGGPGALADILQRNGPFLCMRNHVFDSQLKRQTVEEPPRLQPLSGFLDDTYFKRYFWFYGTIMTRDIYSAISQPMVTKEQMSIALAQLLVQDETALYGLRMFDSMKLLNADNYFVPGKQGYLLFKVRPGEGTPVWSTRVPIRVNAMAVAPERLVIAGAPDVVDPQDPLAAFEARKGGKLRVVSVLDGSMSGEIDLPSPTVFHGVAAARSRVFVALEDGRIMGFTNGDR